MRMALKQLFRKAYSKFYPMIQSINTYRTLLNDYGPLLVVLRDKNVLRTGLYTFALR